MKDITPIEISNNTIIAITPPNHILGENNKKFINLMELSLKIVSKKEYKLVLKTNTEMKNEEYLQNYSLCDFEMQNELFKLKEELKTMEGKIDVLINKVNEKS